MSKKLCFSTISMVLVKCKVKSATQRQLCSALLTSIPGVCDIGHDDSTISNLVHGKINVGADVIDAAKICDRRVFVNNLKSTALTMVDKNKYCEIILVLKDIIESDDSIKSDTEIEMVNNQTKEAILKRNDFVFAEFLAGLLLYVILSVDNRGSREEAGSITQEYINSFSVRIGEILLISSHCNITSVDATKISVDSNIMATIAAAGGKCLCCGRPLAISENGKAVSRAMWVVLPNDAEMVLCADCSCKVQTMTEKEKKELVDRQRSLEQINSARDVISVQRLTDQIEALLREMNTMSASRETHLRHEPVQIEKKIHEMLLLEQVRTDVLHYYDEVNDILDRLAGENSLNIPKFSRQIRQMFVDAEDMLDSQSDIYHLLVDQLNDRTGNKYKDACGIVISYFVQRCEVFNAIAE